MKSVFSKKVMPALALSFAMCAAQLSASGMESGKDKMKANDMPKAPSGMINPPANPPTKEGCGLAFSIDALYLKANEGGLDYALKTAATQGLITNAQDSQLGFNGPTKSADYKWDWGFRLGADYSLEHDGWDLAFSWTYFNTQHSNNVVVFPYNTNGEVLVATNQTVLGLGDGSGLPPFTGGFDKTVYANAKTSLDLRTNFFDLRLGREFFVSKYLTLEPYIGLRDAHINRTFNVIYGGASPVPERSGGLYSAEPHILSASAFLIQHRQNKLTSLGALAGLDAEWGLGSGWSFYSSLDLALLYGRSQSKMAEYQADANNPKNTQTRFNTNVAEYDTRPMTDIIAGIRWEKLFSDSFRLRCQLGWEQHVVFGFNQNITPTGPTLSAIQYRNKNLTLNGVSFQARLDF